MVFELVISKKAAKYLSYQDQIVQDRMLQAIERLQSGLEGDIRPIKGLQSWYRLRVGSYRILFRLDKEERIIYVETIGPRGDIYK